MAAPLHSVHERRRQAPWCRSGRPQPCPHQIPWVTHQPTRPPPFSIEVVARSSMGSLRYLRLVTPKLSYHIYCVVHWRTDMTEIRAHRLQ